MFTSTLVAIGILVSLIILDWQVATSAGLIFFTQYLILSIALKKRLNLNSELISSTKKNQLKVLQEGLGAIRDVLLDNSQHVYVSIFKKYDIPLWRKQAQSQFFAVFPRFAFEALGLIFIALVALLLKIQKVESSYLIPLLGAFALGAQRLLPAMQNIYTAWARIRYQSTMVSDLLSLVEQPYKKINLQTINNPLQFKERIIIKDLKFKYQGQNSKLILENVNLEIKKGDRLGIVGTTGSGKSTLVDIIMGLLPPSSGFIEIDGKKLNKKYSYLSWQASISHVPKVFSLAHQY